MAIGRQRLQCTGPAGGIVIYVKGEDVNGWQYIEAAPASAVMTAHHWGEKGTYVSGTSDAVGAGYEDTNLIVTQFGETEPNAGRRDYADKLCADFSYGGYDDWYLPSKGELELIAGKNGFLVGDFSTDPAYWSSTEVPDNSMHYAWYFGSIGYSIYGFKEYEKESGQSANMKRNLDGENENTNN